MARIKLVKGDQTAINMFTADMDQVIEETKEKLKDIFKAFRQGKCGSSVSDVTLRLFDEWLVRNLLPRTNETVKLTIKEIEKTENLDEIKSKLSRKLPSLKDSIGDYVVEVIAETKKGKSAEESAKKHVWKVYENQLENFLIQAATMLVGRILMHLVGTDKKAWSEITIQQGVVNPYLNYYWTLRRGMNEYLPNVYALNELDWFYISDLQKQGLDEKDHDALKQYEPQLDKNIGRAHNMLKRYNFEFVDLDIWKRVYQSFLSREDSNRLGFVPTPDEIVDLILDVTPYCENIEGLCKLDVLDPACGSGTFLVEALSRLRRHLEARMPCHEKEKGQPEWVMLKERLEIILHNINGIDINPFAAFLTTINLTFLVIDMYAVVKHKYPDFSLAFNVATHDSLADKPVIQKIDPKINSRIKEAWTRSKSYADLCEREFSIVTGNPPWGAVLRGSIGPLGDETQREIYKKKFQSATGKYDFYVLFIERGLNWLKSDGVLSMITQVTYVSQAFGKGIHEVIEKQSVMELFIDISDFGATIFPRHTNYPAITILKKGTGGKQIKLIEVKKNE